MRRLYDSTNAADIPADAEMVMGYVDGSSAWSDLDWARFPNAVKVRLCIWNNRLDAQGIDIEPGNNDAGGAVPFVAGKWARGETPFVYCFTDAGPQDYRISDVRAACDAAGVRHPLFLLTHFDGDPTIPNDPGVIGKQYANDDITGAHYDISAVVDHWPGVDEEEDMTDDKLREAIKRIYAGPDSLEEWVKADVRVMIKQDPETRAAVVQAVGERLAQ